MSKTVLLVNMINVITSLPICRQDKNRDSSICIMMPVKHLVYKFSKKNNGKDEKQKNWFRLIMLATAQH